MKSSYVRELDNGTLAILDCSLFTVTARGPVYIITRVNVPPSQRGRGFGSEILDSALEDADAHGVRLLLEILPSGSEMNYDKLERWYRSRGFKRSKKIDGFFIRKPQ